MVIFLYLISEIEKMDDFSLYMYLLPPILTSIQVQEYTKNIYTHKIYIIYTRALMS